MTLIAIPYTFVAGTTIASAQVNADFQSIVNVVNGNIDGTNLSTVFSTLTEGSVLGTAIWAGGLTINWGAPSNIAFDNTNPSTQTYKTAFLTTVAGVWCQVPQDTQNTPQLVAAYPSHVTNGQFILNAFGGAPNRSGTVFWIALGW